MAHEDPADIIDALSHQLEHAKQDQKAELYFKRANEYRALANEEKAKVDLITGLQISPKNGQAYISLGQLEKGANAAEYFTKGLRYTQDSKKQKSQALQGLSRCAYQLKKYDQALTFCEQSIAFDPANISLILYKSHILWRKGELKKRATYLAEESQKNPSIVIRNSWIDAVIDAGQKGGVGDEVIKIIQQEMQASRFKSSWQIRAALCEPKINAKPNEVAKAYATAAIAEINQRLNLKRPDVTLLMDLARAYGIIQDQAKAQSYIQIAKKLSHSRWEMIELEEAVVR